MCKIKISTKNLNPNSKLLKALKKILGSSVNELKQRMRNFYPLFEEEIFTNRLKEHSTTIREVLTVIEKADLNVNIYQNGFEIDKDILQILLESAEHIFERH